MFLLCIFARVPKKYRCTGYESNIINIASKVRIYRFVVTGVCLGKKTDVTELVHGTGGVSP